MTGTQLSVYQPPLHSLPGAGHPAPAVKIGDKILGSLVVGSLAGYIFYWINRLQARLGWLGEGVVIQPLPYVLSGIMSVAIIETAHLVHDAALYALGDRDESEKLAASDEASSFDRLRQKVWKVIDYADQAQKDIDVIYSRIFNIRTAEQIRTRYATEKDYYLSDPRFMEIVRQAFSELDAKILRINALQELLMYAVEALGYTVFGGHLFVLLSGTMLIVKIMEIHGKKIKEEIEEMNRRRQESDNFVIVQG